MRLLKGLCAFICPFTLVSGTIYAEPSTPEKITHRIHSHLILHDPSSAVFDARKGLENYPNSELLWEAYIKSLAAAGDEKGMLAAWKTYSDHFPNAESNRKLMEAMAWGIIHKANKSSSPLIRICAVLGAFLSQDAKGLELIKHSLNDPNSCVRGIAVKIAAHMRDDKIRDAMLALFLKEKALSVRIEIIKALGEMKIKNAKPMLVEIIGSSKTTAQEKVAAMHALIEMLDTVDSQEVGQLVVSDRAGLRLIACQVVSRFDLMCDIDSIYPLLKDSCSEVRSAAIEVFGSLRMTTYRDQSVADLADCMLNDTDPNVAISAARVLTLMDSNRGQRAFQKLLNHEQREYRIIAAGALSSCGKYALPLEATAFKTTSDPYVRMNLALGLIGQREQLYGACDVLCDSLAMQDERWTWHDAGTFKVLMPVKLAPDAILEETPETVNQQVRLEILNMVALLHYSKAQESLEQCLSKRQWGITGGAAALLLTEGDAEALDIVRNLLESPQENVRIQAALILAMWGKDTQAIALLQNAYKSADKELKERILESIGRVGERSSLPFLMDKLNEPSQSLRIIAASALLETLYN